MFTRKIISSLLILFYLTAVIGIGVYKCHCDHSGRLSMLTYNHCECAHHSNNPSSCDKQDCHHSESDCPYGNDDDCCTVVYEYITIDQENSSQKAVNFSNTLMLLAVILPSFIESPDVDNFNNTFDYSKSPPEHLKIPLIYQNCQLRL